MTLHTLYLLYNCETVASGFSMHCARMLVVMGHVCCTISMLLIFMTCVFPLRDVNFVKMSKMCSAVDKDATQDTVVRARSAIHCATLCLTRQQYSVIAYSKYSKSCSCFGNGDEVSDPGRQANTTYFMKKGKELV